MSDLNCMVQFATSKDILIDSDLMSFDDALELFNQNIGRFKDELELGNEPEMALWVNCKDNSCYGDTLHHWHASEFIVLDGTFYKQV